MLWSDRHSRQGTLVRSIAVFLAILTGASWSRLPGAAPMSPSRASASCCALMGGGHGIPPPSKRAVVANPQPVAPKP